jgi:hypothetical protein
MTETAARPQVGAATCPAPDLEPPVVTAVRFMNLIEIIAHLAGRISHLECRTDEAGIPYRPDLLPDAGSFGNFYSVDHGVYREVAGPATYPQHANGHAPAGPPEAARLPRHLSYITGTYDIRIGYAELTVIMDKVFEVWDMLKLDATDEGIGDGFSELAEHVAYLRAFTGWGGVAGKYLR